MAVTQRWDVFVSYAHEDKTWVQALAENLHRAGLDVFFDEWEVVGGARLSQRLQEGLAASDVVVLVVSAAAIGKPWWQEEFAAAMAGVTTGPQRLIPVLLDEVALPLFVANRLYVDFRHLDSPDAYVAAFDRLVRFVRGLPAGERPARDGAVVVPPSVYRAEGPRPARLQIAVDEVVFTCAETEAQHKPKGVDASLRTLLWDLDRARNRPGARPDNLTLRAGTDSGGGVLHAALVEVGRALGARFADGPAGQALAERLATVASGGATLRLAVQVEDPELADLPWETLILPGQDTPLVLQTGIELHRAVAVADPPAMQVPGPLRILAVIASPDRGGGELLDYEAELARILAVVDPSRRDHAYVRVLNWGTPTAIREALAEERFHILHLSCHARPGALVLESDTGDADIVTAQRLVREVLVPDQGVPLVVLAGCSTALADRTPHHPGNSDGEGEQVLAGLARQLLHAGIPAVLAMTASITDVYATELCASMYRQLARRPEPVPLAELSTARRLHEDARRALPPQDHRAVWAEWATPAMFQAGPALPLYHRDTAPVPTRSEARPALGGMIRRVGDFVGRRTELRAILRDLRAGRRGAVLHGIGGIGKSSLAAQLVEHLGADAGLVVPIVGATRVDLILEQIRQRLLGHCLRTKLAEQHPLRQVTAMLIDATPPWEQRLALLREVVLPEVPILLLFDNAEDLLTPTPTDDGGPGWELTDAQLAAFTTAWLQLDTTRLIVTTRYPFTLPDRAHRRLAHHHLGPLSKAETRKLIWRLPALDRLDPAQRLRAYTDVGGHPRSLEYLDALLAGGHARFDDVADRLERALEPVLADRGITHLDQWLHGVAGDLDRAVAETITLTADDVLLDGLLARLDTVPGARDLLFGAAVYRHPVDDIGLAWHLADIHEPAPDPDRAARMRATGELLLRAHRENLSPEEVGLSPEQLTVWERDREELRRPPFTTPPVFDRARDVLLRMGLLSPVTTPESDQVAPVYTVHRWTAAALTHRTPPTQHSEAHRRAARYWQWRVDVWPQDRTTDITELVETRYHHHQAGDLAPAVAATYTIRNQLHTWGAWTWEHDLCTETLTWLPPTTNRDTATFTYQLGIIAQERGDYAQAEQRYHASLTIREELGDRAGIAAGYGQLGNIAQERGDYAQAEQRYHACLTIFEELGDRAGIAAGYHQLGMIAQERGDYAQAEQRCHASLTIREELGNRAGIASTTSQLGVLHTEQDRAIEAVPYNLTALLIRIDIDSPEARTDLYWLGEQRRALGEETFSRLLHDHLDAENAAALLVALDNPPDET